MKRRIVENTELTKAGCWEWKGSRSEKGYGLIKVDGKSRRAHRVAAMLWLGFDIDSDLYICHKCDNPPCCNPDHLFIGTHQDNMLDRVIKSGSLERKRQQRFKHVDKVVKQIVDALHKFNKKKHNKQHNCKINKDIAEEIRNKYNQGNTSQRKLAKEYGLAHSNIKNIVNGASWK